MALSRRTQQRLVTFVLIGVAFALFGSLGPVQGLVLGVGMVAIGVGVIVQKRRRRSSMIDGPGDGRPP
jgi:hypothetical protein